MRKNKIVYLSREEQLKESLKYVSARFLMLSQLLPTNIRLNEEERRVCEDTFVLENNERIEFKRQSKPKSFNSLVHQMISQILRHGKTGYVQCLGYELTSCGLKYRSFNFNTAILESSIFKILFERIDDLWLYNLLCNSTVIANYRGEYVQVTGKLLTEEFRFKVLGDNWKKNRFSKTARSVDWKGKKDMYDFRKNKVVSKSKTSVGEGRPVVKLQGQRHEPMEAEGVKRHRTASMETQLNIYKQYDNFKKQSHQNARNMQVEVKPKVEHTNYSNSRLKYENGQWNIASTFQSCYRHYHYSSQQIKRGHIFYCNHINRRSGIFGRNIYYAKDAHRTSYINQSAGLVIKCINQYIQRKVSLTAYQLQWLPNLLKSHFDSVRNLFALQQSKGIRHSPFDALLALYCRLPSGYRKLRDKVNQYLFDKYANSELLFEQMYCNSTPYEAVQKLLRHVLQQTIPDKLIGLSNKKKLRSMMGQFVRMKRFEKFKMDDFLKAMDVFEVEWIGVDRNKRHHRQQITRGRRYLAAILALLLNEFIIPVMKYNFYITEKHKEANKIFYFRKPIWSLVSKLAVCKFSEANLERIDQKRCAQLNRKSILNYPEGKLRLVPKKGTFRPILTFNRKLKVEANPNSKLRLSMNQLLIDTQLVLRNLKAILGRKGGYCVFDNSQMTPRYDQYVRKWQARGRPSLKYFTVDINKCYDSIDTSKLIRIIEETPYIEDFYIIINYLRLYRNKRPLDKKQFFSAYFNVKERVRATPLSQDLLEITAEHKVPSINIYTAKQRSISRETVVENLQSLCEGSIINYRGSYWLQKVGIPQGLNVSGVLCSLYFSKLEENYVKVEEGLLMRHTDDYLYIGPQSQAVTVLSSLLQCGKDNGFSFSENKISMNFHHPQVNRMSKSNQVTWIGKRINITTLQIFPSFEMTSRLAFAMNVNLPQKKLLKGFLKNKFKSMLTNQFVVFFKPHLFEFDNLAINIRLYAKVSLEKFFPFLVELRRLKLPEQAKLILKIFNDTLSEFLIYACMLANKHQDIFYNRLYIVVVEEFLKFFKTKRSCHSIREAEKYYTIKLKHARISVQRAEDNCKRQNMQYDT